MDTGLLYQAISPVLGLGVRLYTNPTNFSLGWGLVKRLIIIVSTKQVVKAIIATIKL